MANACFVATDTTLSLSTIQTFKNLQPPYLIHIGGESSGNTNKNSEGREAHKLKEIKVEEKGTSPEMGSGRRPDRLESCLVYRLLRDIYLYIYFF